MSSSFSLPASASSTATISHDARIALPPTQGANLNAAVMVALVSGASACTWTRYQPTAGRLDHGPVHSRDHHDQHGERHPGQRTSPAGQPMFAGLRRDLRCVDRLAAMAQDAASGRQTFSSSSSAQKQTMEPVTSGRYGPK